MNDRFKFRVWDKGNEQYLNLSEVDYLTLDTENGGLIIGFLDELMTEMTYMPEKDMVVEQCTGVKDKNGKMIFEGDIVQYKISGVPPITAVVRWSDESAQFCKDSQSLTSYIKSTVVIGNIHEQKD